MTTSEVGPWSVGAQTFWLPHLLKPHHLERGRGRRVQPRAHGDVHESFDEIRRIRLRILSSPPP
jgi:hypothetical protein